MQADVKLFCRNPEACWIRGRRPESRQFAKYLIQDLWRRSSEIEKLEIVHCVAQNQWLGNNPEIVVYPNPKRQRGNQNEI